ncbi:MAG: metal-dependent phosphohydrolase [SAR86 cluster bacterium]|uniref:Metal-dependent phosphohydrolase n=1 Tax=SAR86 cluster bacterium TaxID=2030880 RepID=A0A2A4X5V3_9GAMM|nr:MAG: metal-dependent phosphohydrolase [SAR86 cluster bacterium]
MADAPQRPDLDTILGADLQAFVNNILHEDGGIDHFRQLLSDDQISKLESRRKLELVTRSGVIFTRERNISNILETTLNTARNLTNSDGGTIYSLEEIYAENPIDPGEIASRNLNFVALQNETMDTNLKGGDIDMMPPVPLEIDGKPNLSNVSAYCANTGEMLNFDDVYDADGFDFTGTSSYDEANGYRSQSMLVIPLEDHENNIIGVLQLINRRMPNGAIGGFTTEDIELVQSVSFPAAASITQQRMINEQVNLFNAFVTMLAQGLGEKSPHTYNHIRRVAALGESIAASLSNSDEGIYADVKYNSDEMAEIKLAGWMHDIGKITTPEHIVSKQVKLQFVMDRFEMIIERCSSKMKDYKIEMLQQQLAASQAGATESELLALRNECDNKTSLLEKQLEALFKANRGSEDMPKEQIELVMDLASQSVEAFYKTEVIIDHGFPLLKSFALEPHVAPLIDDREKSNLLIKRGTLSDDERDQIKSHADRSWRWLMELPFPRKQKRLPLYAGAHHEHLNGSGYPNGIEGKDMPMQARILAIADIFEALVANDRPYKEPMPLSQAMNILGGMVKSGNLDGELMKIFLQSGDYMTYAEEHLNPEQIDDVDIDAWLEAYYVVPEPPTK